ncbi:MAG: 3-phosphoshikimate 1-carboxyvinyltransferase [Victivallales bacterium]|nr:3-phosphoshikimate 1-carboxyvinyltransferase [Victivallales bacterium]
MMIFEPKSISGNVAAIPAKAEAHRALIAAALADKPTLVRNLSKMSNDILVTLNALCTLGAKFERTADGVLMTPIHDVPSEAVVDCGESGSTLRFLLPVISALVHGGKRVRVTGGGRLPERPMADLLRVLRNHGAAIDGDKLPFEVTGELTAGTYELPGNVSSQYVTGLMFTLPLLNGDSEIRLTTPLESTGYVDMTKKTLSLFDVQAEGLVKGGQKFRSPREIMVGGDWSNAAMWLAAGALSGPVTMTGLDMDSAQGDRAIVDILRLFGAIVTIEDNAITVSRGILKGIELDMRDIPDLLPVLSIVAAVADGETRFVNAGRLRLKESDRLATVAALLKALGGKVEDGPDWLAVQGTGRLKGGECEIANDHRLVMAAVLASCISEESVKFDGFKAIDKSYPTFMEDYRKLEK